MTLRSRSYVMIPEPEGLSPDRRFILEQKRNYLATTVDLQGSDLLELLKRDGVVSEEEEMKIKRKRSEESQISTLVDYLLDKNNTHYDVFCSALERTNQVKVTEELANAIQKCTSSVQKKLHRHYKECFSQLDVLNKPGGWQRVLVEPVYVPLRLVTCKKTSNGEEKKELQHYTELLDELENHNLKRVFLRGESMIGKTTFMRKICYDWAKEFENSAESKKKDKQISPTQILKEFTLILPILLRLVRPYQTLHDVIGEQFNFFSETDIRTVLYMVAHDTSMLLLDGLDEYNNLSTDINQIIRGQYFPETYCFIISSRDGVSNLGERMKCWHVIADFIRLNKREIEQYVKNFSNATNYPIAHINKILTKVLPTEKELKHNSEDDLARRNELYGMAGIPGKLGMLCLLWAERQQLPESRNQIYQDFVLLVMQLTEVYRNSPAKDEDDLMVAYKDILLGFGKLANSRQYGLMSTVFSMEEITNTVRNEDVLKYGLLCKSNSVLSEFEGGAKCFTHKSIQDWLAAFYIARSDDLIEYPSYELVPRDVSLHQFLNYLDSARMDEVTRQALLDCFTDGSDSTEDQVLALLDWQEYGGVGMNLCVFLASTALAMKTRSLFLSHSPTLHGLCGGLGRLMVVLTNCRRWFISNCGLDATDMAEMVDAIGHTPLKIEQLYLEHNFLRGAGRSLGGLLLQMNRCTTLDLAECCLIVTDIEDLVQAITDNLPVKTLDISRNFLRGGETPVRKLLDRMPSCTTVNVTSTDLKVFNLQRIKPDIQFQLKPF